MEGKQSFPGRNTVRVVVLWSALLLGGCSGGGSGDETISIRLASDQDCYGFTIEIDQSGLPASDLGTSGACTADPALTDLGCETDASTSPDQYELSASGCFAPSDTALYLCTIPKALAERFRDTAQLRCGCGCATECPGATAAVVCREDGTHCESAVVRSAPASIATDEGTITVERTPGVAQATTVTSTTTYCGTCCDVQDIDTGVRLSDDVPVRELRFDLAMNIDERFCPQFNGCSVSTSFDGPNTVEFDGDSIHVCLSAKDAVVGPTHLLSCSINSDGTDEYEVSGVSALDQEFRAITPAPAIENDFGVE